LSHAAEHRIAKVKLADTMEREKLRGKGLSTGAGCRKQRCSSSCVVTVRDLAKDPAILLQKMTHPLVSRLAPMMNGDLQLVHRLVAQWVLESPTEEERAVLRYFGAELGAVQRRIKRRSEPPTEEEIEIALTAVLALVHRKRVKKPQPS
jgi:hypothetical protein